MSKEEKTESKVDLQPWVEKYRPQKLDDIAHQEEVVQTLRRSLQTANLQHLLFYGPPGTGKTSTILAVAKQLYGPTLWKRRVLELNASHERGIDVIRTRVKDFAQIAVGTRDNTPGYPCPPYKIIILDEADSMTRDAQAALRRTLENYTKVTRFCIICNYVSRIIEPLASRCSKFRFKPLSEDAMIKRLTQICEAEDFQAPQEALNTLIQVSEGDMRKSINLLQTAHNLLDDEKGVLTAENIYDVAGIIPKKVISGLIDATKKQGFQGIQDAAHDVISAGYPIDGLLNQLQPEIIKDPEISDTQKSKICIRLAEADKKLVDGADEFMQLLDVLSYITTTINTPE